jgi:hypothetical protein
VKGPKGWEGGPFYLAIRQQQGFSRFNTIFKFLAGTTFKTFADFVGIDENINTWKGDLLRLDYGIDQIKDKHIQGSNIPSKWLEVLNHMAAAIEVIHHPDVVQDIPEHTHALNSRLQKYERPRMSSTRELRCEMDKMDGYKTSRVS